MKTYLAIFAWFGFLVAANAAEVEIGEKFSAANTKLRAAEYDAAIEAYRSLSQEGVTSAELYANLGEANRVKGDVVGASTNYLRALTLDPGQRQAAEGLARLSASAGLPRYPRGWLNDFVMIAHPETLVVIGTATFWVGVLFFGVSLFSGRKPLPTAGALVIAACGVALFTVGWVGDPRLAEGEPGVVIAEKEARVLTNPSDNAAPITSVPKATPVRLLSPRGAWTYVEMPGGVRGWISTDQVKSVWPVDEDI